MICVAGDFAGGNMTRALVTIGGLALFLLGNVAADLPRYSLPVGHQLAYSSDYNFRFTNGSFNDLDTVQITVIGANADGSARILVREGDRDVQNRDGRPTTRPENQPEEVTISQFDLFPDGRVVNSKGNDFESAPQVLCPLPTSDEEMSGTWRQDSQYADSIVFKSMGLPADGKWVFTSSQEGIDKLIYGITEENTFHFDLAKGIVTLIENKAGQDYGFHGSGGGATRLLWDEMIPADKVAVLASDAALYFKTGDDWKKEIGKVSQLPRDAAAVATAKNMIKQAVANIVDADLKAGLKQQLSQVDDWARENCDDSNKQSGLVDKPVLDIEAKDLDGHPHRLSDYRGEVVVLDFWYRGCGWCMRAMPELKKLSEDMTDQPVVFLGMNTDSDPKDAKFVVDALGISYPILSLSRDQQDKFGIYSFPTIMIVDRAGIVRYLDSGYSPTMRETLGKKIQEILGGDKKYKKSAGKPVEGYDNTAS
jgi:thiol-disulfide isomerase/thioredoxin